MVPDERDRPRSALQVPSWLARRHRQLGVGDRLDVPAGVVELAPGPAHPRRPGPDWAGLAEGGGFAVAGPRRLRRLDSLPDVVGPGMAALIVGLNPSPTAAATGIGFARPGNRFWPAALAAGLVSRDREPFHALDEHGVGFTDLAKRTTRRAAELAPAEFTAGLGRLDALCGWLRPGVCVMVGLMGWRAAVERGAVAGWQDRPLGGRPVYVMPSTSGLNAATSLDELVEHLTTATRPVGAGR